MPSYADYFDKSTFLRNTKDEVLTIKKTSVDKGLIVHTVVMNDQGQVLVMKRQSKDNVLPGAWDIPGGTLEDGEGPAVGAIRETHEESGLKIVNPRLFHFTSNIDTTKNKQFVRLIFWAKSNGTVQLNSEEHSEYQWINPADLPDLQFVDYLPTCFERLSESLK